MALYIIELSTTRSARLWSNHPGLQAVKPQAWALLVFLESGEAVHADLSPREPAGIIDGMAHLQLGLSLESVGVCESILKWESCIDRGPNPACNPRPNPACNPSPN